MDKIRHETLGILSRINCWRQRAINLANEAHVDDEALSLDFEKYYSYVERQDAQGAIKALGCAGIRVIMLNTLRETNIEALLLWLDKKPVFVLRGTGTVGAFWITLTELVAEMKLLQAINDYEDTYFAPDRSVDSILERIGAALFDGDDRQFVGFLAEDDFRKKSVEQFCKEQNVPPNMVVDIMVRMGILQHQHLRKLRQNAMRTFGFTHKELGTGFVWE